MLAVGSVGQGVVGDPPCCRGQAVPGPPARRAGNPVVRRWAWWWVGRRGGRCMPRRMPRLEARRARQHLAPTGWDDPSPVGYWGATAGCPPCGRGQAVPDPLARPGQQSSPRDDDRDTRIIDTSGQHRSARHSLSSEGTRAPRGAARASHPPPTFGEDERSRPSPPAAAGAY